MINTEKISGYVKENIPMTVYFKREANDSIKEAFGKQLKNSQYIKDYVYVSKEDAAKNNPDIMGDYENLAGRKPAYWTLTTFTLKAIMYRPTA